MIISVKYKIAEWNGWGCAEMYPTKVHIEILWNPDFFGYCWSLFCRRKSKERKQN